MSQGAAYGRTISENCKRQQQRLFTAEGAEDAEELRLHVLLNGFGNFEVCPGVLCALCALCGKKAVAVVVSVAIDGSSPLAILTSSP